MVIRLLSTLLLAMVLFADAGLAADPVAAYLDRSRVQEGEIVTLTLEIKGGGGAGRGTPTPELAPLDKDFVVLGTSQSSQISIVNGRRNDSLKFQVTLQPRQTGDLLVPSLEVGGAKTRPLALKVTALEPGAPAAGPGQGRGDLFVEVEVDPKRVYVGQPVIYTARIFQGMQVQQDNLTPPILEGGSVERLGDATAYQKRRDGREYRVVEVRFLLIPEQVGEIVIPGPLYQGGIPQQRRSRFGGGLFDSPLFDRMVTNLRPVRAKGAEARLSVKPPPAAAEAGGGWLPARKVELFEAFNPDPPLFRVGEPVTRTLTLRATGVKAEQIPDFPQRAPEGVNLFADQPVLETRLDGGIPVGVRLEKQALAPKRAGEITLPAIRVPWWDVTADRARVAVLPPRTVTVLPAAGGNAPPPAPPRKEAPAPSVQAAPKVVPAVPAPVAGFAWWPHLAGFFLLGWAVTLGLWLRARRGSAGENPAKKAALDEAAWRNKVEAACRRGDATGVKAALLGWSGSRWGEGAPHSLPGLAARLNDPAAREALADLDRRLYAPDPEAGWSGPDFWDRVGGGMMAPTDKGDPVGTNGLPALYPDRD